MADSTRGTSYGAKGYNIPFWSMLSCTAYCSMKESTTQWTEPLHSRGDKTQYWNRCENWANIPSTKCRISMAGKTPSFQKLEVSQWDMRDVAFSLHLAADHFLVSPKTFEEASENCHQGKALCFVHDHSTPAWTSKKWLDSRCQPIVVASIE